LDEVLVRDQVKISLSYGSWSMHLHLSSKPQPKFDVFSVPMKNLFLSIFAFVSVALAGQAAEVAAPVYELRVYSAHEGKMPELLARFRDHTCALFERHGMTNIGYWTPVDAKDGNKLYYVLQHASREVAKASWKSFGADPEWQTAKKASEANGSLVDGVESTFLALTDYSPVQSPLKGSHVFELRTYTTNEGKLDTLDTRFRDHTMTIFSRHGMTNLQYWHPLDADKGAGKTLIYILAHNSREAATKSWADFQADPEWVKVRNASEEAGKILAHAPASVFLTPTDFSALK
jgi:NIPSNAP protein